MIPSIHKIMKISLVLLVVLFALFVGLYERFNRQNDVLLLNEHAAVISEALWNLDKQSPVSYLEIAARESRYENINIFSEGDSFPFLSIYSKPRHVVDQVFVKFGLIKKRSMTADIEKAGRKIGTVEVVHLHSTIYIYLYVLIPCLLLLTAVNLLTKLMAAKSDLEFRVAERTKEVRAIHDLFSSVIDSMPSILLCMDHKSRIILWNQKAEELREDGRGIDNGESVYDVFPSLADEREKIDEAIDRNLIGHCKNKARSTAGGMVYEDITIYPLSAGDSHGVVVLVDDVTKAHRLGEQLYQSRKMESIGTLAGGVAHDFNNMLGGIVGAADLLRISDNLDSSDFELVELISKSSSRAADLTAKLLAFGRKGKMNTADLELDSVVYDAVDILRYSIDKKVTLSVESKASRFVVHGDASQLQNAIMNLIINAEHAMTEAGNIVISMSNIFISQSDCDLSPFDLQPGEYINVEVRDTGCGIPVAALAKIFEPFYTTKKEGKGTGLGLAAVYGTVQNHKGLVRAYSEVGKGTSFHISLPCSVSSVVSVEPAIPTALKGTGHVLLIDDEEIIRAVGKIMLEKMGYHVLTAVDGEDGIRVFCENQSLIDLVITDLVMPKKGGREVFFELKKIDPECRIVISSGFSENGDMKELKDEGLLGFIHKPYQHYELSKMVTEILQ